MSYIPSFPADEHLGRCTEQYIYIYYLQKIT